MTYSTSTLSRPCVCQKCGQVFTDGGRGRKNLTCPDCKIPKCRTCRTPVVLIWRGGPKAGFYPTGYYCSDDCKPRCPIEGCERPVRKRGWCVDHYAAKRYAKDPERMRRKRREYYYTVERRRGRERPLEDRLRDSDPSRRRALAERQRGPCLTCGTSDVKYWTRASLKFCSARCQTTWRKYDGDVPVSFDCAVCGVEVFYFDPVTRRRLRSDAAYCVQHVRHARVYVTVEEIADEDGSDCKLCGDPVDLSIPGPNRWAPSVDHIIPRAHGGSDRRENLQLAHKGCNSSKRHYYAG